MRIRFIGLIATVLILFTSIPYSVFADSDPAAGTAEQYIEDAIKAGMELKGKSPYLWGGGRTEDSYGKAMDCSAFMHYIFNKGSGLLLLNDNPKHAGEGPGGSAVTTVSLKSNMDVIKNVSIDDLERGDMIFFTGHVGLYLGEGKMLHDAGAINKPLPGVSIGDVTSSYWSSRYTGEVIKVAEGVKGVTVDEDFKRDSTSEDTAEEIESASDTGAKGLQSLVGRKTVLKETGVENNQEVFGADNRNLFNSFSYKVYTVLIKIGVYMSYAFIGYTSVAVVAYFAIAFRGSNMGALTKFENFTGIDMNYTKENTKKLLGRWAISVAIMSIFLMGMHLDLMALVYTLIDKVWFI